MNRSTYRLMCGVFVCLVWLIGADAVCATTVTATATGDGFSPEARHADSKRTESGQGSPESRILPPATVKRDSANWTFDLTRDPNFAAFARDVRALKSASLTLTVAPEHFQISSDALGLQPLADDEQQKPVNFSVQVEVDLLELYEPDELLDLLASNAGKLQIPYPNPEAISAAEIHLTTDTPELLFSRSMLIVTGTLALLIISVGGVWWQRRSSADQAARAKYATDAEHTEVEARMALVGSMASTIVHDVKNAFTAIRSCAEVIGDEALNPDARKDFAQLIVNEIDRGVDMTQELLDFTSGKHRALNRQPTNIARLLEDMLPVVRQDLQARHMTVAADLSDTGTVSADASKLKRVFANIISNARDAMPEGGCLRIASSVKQARVCVEFSDTGCGMTPELQARMFEPMVTHGKAHGTGLGLAIVKDILDAHHADIMVQSEVGKGTTIRMFFPYDA